MKQYYLKKTLDILKKQYPDLTDIELDEYRYGLEGFYLTVTKSFVIFPIAFILGIGKELLILFIFFNFLRKYACGLHATKSWICLCSSSMIFLTLPFLAKNIVIPMQIKIILGIITTMLFLTYAPADTQKAPIIYKEKRKKQKIISTILCIAFIICSVLISNSTISNLILFSVCVEAIMILPLTYRLFHLPYNNYKNYVMRYNL